MKKEVYTIVIMSFSGCPVRTFSISMVSLIIALSVVSLFASSGIAYGIVKTLASYKGQIDKTEAVVEKYVNLQKDFQNLQKEFIKIKKNYQDFKSILGVETLSSDYPLVGSIDSDLQGKGGPEEDELSYEVTPDEIADNLKTDINSTMKEAIILKYDLKEFVNNVSEKMAKLAMIPSICPVMVGFGTGYRMSSNFGLRLSPFNGMIENHQGLDIAAPFGTPIIATADGTIADTGTGGGLGNYVTIRHDDRCSTVYGHMNNLAYGIERGAKVKRYDIIGYVGTTGRSTGYHVHYEVRIDGQRVNPLDYILN